MAIADFPHEDDTSFYDSDKRDYLLSELVDTLEQAGFSNSDLADLTRFIRMSSDRKTQLKITVQAFRPAEPAILPRSNEPPRILQNHPGYPPYDVPPAAPIYTLITTRPLIDQDDE